MTTYSKQTLATFFQDGDIPTGTDYANLIDSQVNIVETSAQSMGGALIATEFIAPRVSATNVNVTGTLTAAAFSFVGSFSAATVNATTVNTTTLTATGDVSAATGTVYASALRTSNGTFEGVPLIVSAAGTTQATATPLTASICRLQGATNGSTTGFVLPANKAGWIQYLANECTVSANLWPPSGGNINALGANTVFPMVANTPYIVIHSQNSAYSVK